MQNFNVNVNVNVNVNIVLLHGLGAHPITLEPLRLYLAWSYPDIKSIHNIVYQADRQTLEQSVMEVSTKMEKLLGSKKEVIVVIGQSMGGLVSNRLHKYGWSNIRKTITIGAPLHGARFLSQLEALLPTLIRNWFYKLPYDSLKHKQIEQEPPHDYHNITMSWFWTTFDGCVYRDEACFGNEEKTTHLNWADHRTIFANPRLWFLVSRLIF